MFLAVFLALFLLLWLLLTVVEPLLERLLARVAHWTASFRYGDYSTVVVLLVAGVAGAALAGDAFLDIAERVQAGSPEVRQMDARVHSWARSTHTAGATAFFVTMTTVGQPLVLGGAVVLTAAMLVARKRWSWAAYVAFTTAVGGLLNKQMKLFFARDRPDLAEALRTADGYAFPSGHAMGATVVFGALSYLALRRLPRPFRPPALAVAATITVAIAASRVYLGVHWISDVGAGLAAGAIWVIVTTVAYEIVRRIRLVRALRSRRQLNSAHSGREET